MARQLKPQRTTPPTQNDLRQALASVDSLIVNVEGLQEWRKEINKRVDNQDSDTLAAIEKQFEIMFSRLNKIEAKIKEIDKKVNGSKATASPLKVASKSEPKPGQTTITDITEPTNGDIDVE